jgi:hypothetical protein
MKRVQFEIPQVRTARLRLGATHQGPIDFLGSQALVFKHPPAGA